MNAKTWYPVNGSGSLLLVHAHVNAEDGEADCGIVFSFDEAVTRPFDPDADAKLESELLDVATNMGHKNWVGFDALRALAFPKKPPLENWQLREDTKLVTRIDKYGKCLDPAEAQFVEDMCRRVLEHKEVMTPNQRAWAERIDDSRVA